MTDGLSTTERTSSKQTGVIAAISRKSRQDWLPFNWRVKPIVRIDVDSDTLLRVGELADIQSLPLLSRFAWPQSRFPAEQMQKLLEECDSIFLENDDAEIRETIEAVVQISHMVEAKKYSYPDILWLLVDRSPPKPKSRRKSR